MDDEATSAAVVLTSGGGGGGALLLRSVVVLFERRYRSDGSIPFATMDVVLEWPVEAADDGCCWGISDMEPLARGPFTLVWKSLLDRPF